MDVELDQIYILNGTIQRVVLVASIPYILSVTAYILLIIAAWESTLMFATLSLVALLSRKVPALPVGFFLLGFG